MNTKMSITTLLLALLTVTSIDVTVAQQKGEAIFFTYFKGNGESGVFLKKSDDGFDFESVNNDQPVFTPPDSWPEDQQLTRDPSVTYHNGTFHMVWTTNWEGQVFGYANSPDLKNWSEPRLVRPFPKDLPEDKQPQNVWAPEIHYDPVEGDFFIIFSSTIPERLDEDAMGKDKHGNNHRMYITRSNNFDSFSNAKLFYDPGYSSIDGQLVYNKYGSPQKEDDRWIMVFKHERVPENGGKNLRLVFRDPVTGEFTDYSEPIVGPDSGLNNHWVEGPTLLRTSDGWWNLYWDAYITGYYGLVRSPDLKNWSEATEKLHINVDHPRHGTFFKAPLSETGWSEEE